MTIVVSQGTEAKYQVSIGDWKDFPFFGKGANRGELSVNVFPGPVRPIVFFLRT